MKQHSQFSLPLVILNTKLEHDHSMSDQPINCCSRVNGRMWLSKKVTAFPLLCILWRWCNLQNSSMDEQSLHFASKHNCISSMSMQHFMSMWQCMLVMPCGITRGFATIDFMMVISCHFFSCSLAISSVVDCITQSRKGQQWDFPLMCYIRCITPTTYLFASKFQAETQKSSMTMFHISVLSLEFFDKHVIFQTRLQ